MPLTRRDLEAIRAIVREELARHLGTSVEATSDVDVNNEGDEIAAFARASLAVLRGEPGAEELELKAEARYRVLHEEGYRRRARKWLGKAPDEPVSIDEMERALRAWRAENKRRAAKAAETRQRKRRERDPGR